MRLTLLLALLSLAAGPAQAFPVAEGAGALSSLVGVVAAAIAGLFPKGGSKKADQRFVLAVGATLVVSAIAAGAVFRTVQLSRQAQAYEIIASQSRPQLELSGEIAKDMASRRSAPVSAEDLAWAATHDLIVDLDDFRAGRIAKTATRLYIGHDSTKRTDQPFHAALLIEKGDAHNLLETVNRLQGDVVLLADTASELIAAAKFLETQIGKAPQGLALFSPEFSRPESAATQPKGPKERQTDRQEDGLPRLHDPARVFTLPMLDIRARRDVLETHTLVNAANVPALDLLLMRDSELEALFPPGRVTVLLSYDESEYPRVHARLKEVVPGRYSFYSGGLYRHFFEDRKTITPYYYNLRKVDPLKLTEVYGLTGRVRFICTVPSQCLDNIPKGDRIDIPFRDMSPGEFARRISELPEEGLYVTVTSNQETSGNALIAGYWLIQSGHAYIGDLVMQDRFSLEELRALTLTESPEDLSLEGYRAAHAAKLAILEAISEASRQYGWVLTFALLGVLARLALAPAQLLVIRSYYSVQGSLVTTLGATAAIFTGLVTSYLFLEEAISYYAVIPHQEMNDMSFAVSRSLLQLFVAMIALQILLSFPLRARLAGAIILAVAVLWSAGFMDSIPQPLLVFLMASEAVALLLQAPAFFQHLARLYALRAGIATKVLPGMVEAELPEKWRLLTDLQPQPGFLFDLSASSDSLLFRLYLFGTPGKRLIVRSASLSEAENALGGYYSSHDCRRDLHSVRRCLDALRAEGCSHAWIQPLFRHDEAGVLTSIDRAGRRGALIYGPPGAATEGARGTRTVFLDTRDKRRHHRREWRLLRRAEKHFGGPVSLEIGRCGRRVIPHQVRCLDEDLHPETRLLPGGIQGVVLAEDFMVSCSRLTGDILSEISDGRYTAVRGYLYRSKSAGQARLVTAARLRKLEGEVTALARQLSESRALGPAAALAATHEALSLLKQLYRSSQARFRPSSISTRLNPNALETQSHMELEIIGDKRLDTTALNGGHLKERETRDHLHDLIALCIYSLNRILHLTMDAHLHDRIGLKHLLENTPLPARRPEVDEAPLTRALTPEEGRGTIVSGQIAGTPWSADGPAPGKDVSGPLVLAGEEIGSEWVKHLHRFDGILSVYGHAASHLGISARRLGIPYRLVTPEDLSVFLSGGEGDAEGAAPSKR